MSHFWFGKEISEVELEQKIELIPRLKFQHNTKFSPLSFIKTLSLWAENGLERLKEDFPESRDVFIEVQEFCSFESLNQKYEKEIGGRESLFLKRTGFEGNYFEKRAPLGSILHILPGNSEGLSFLASIEAAMVGNYSICKLSEQDSATSMNLLRSLSSFDNGVVSSKIAFLKLSSTSPLLSKTIKLVDAVSAWGGDGAIASIKNQMPPQTRFIPWGHKISFGLITKKTLQNLNDELIKELAKDIFQVNQLACSSPQCLFLEIDNQEELFKLSRVLYEGLKGEEVKYPALNLDPSAVADLQNEMLIEKFREAQGEAMVLAESLNTLKVISEYRFDFKPSPLNRTLLVRPISKGKLADIFSFWGDYLQTGILAASDQYDFLSWSKALLGTGLTRVVLPGKSLLTYSGEPHDGEFALSRFTKLQRVEVPEAEHLFTLDFDSYEPVREGKLTGKIEFQNQTENNKTNYYFKSGGSSGDPKYSRFSNNDYHRQMSAAAEGLLAAGIEPGKDRVMNLFYGGNLYGGFLSFTTILEKLDVVQFPMGASEDFDYVGKQIQLLNVNTILGMPSYIMSLFKSNKALRENHKVSKIYYGGEHFSLEQVSWLKNEVGISTIKSASYGSVDAGPIGFQCKYLTGGQHHIFGQIHSHEIFSLEKDELAQENERGRLILTSIDREAMSIKRYDVGDIVSPINGHCKCGSPFPRFELQGRVGDIFRVSGNFLNYSAFLKALGENGFHAPFQLKIAILPELTESLTLSYGESTCDPFEIKRICIENLRELKEAYLLDKSMEFIVEVVSEDKLDHSVHSGKVLRVIDMRSRDDI